MVEVLQSIKREMEFREGDKIRVTHRNGDKDTLILEHQLKELVNVDVIEVLKISGELGFVTGIAIVMGVKS